MLPTIFLVLSLTARSEASEPLRIKGEIVPASADVAVLYEGSKYHCFRSFENPSKGCEVVSLPENARTFTIEITARGWQRWTANVALTKNQRIIALGSVRLTPSTLPTVRQIVPRRSPTGALNFELTIDNSGSRPIIVTALELDAGLDAMMNCMSSRLPKVALNHKLRVVRRVFSRGGSEVAEIEGQALQEDVPGLAATFRGFLWLSGCLGESQLGLRLPTSLTLPAQSISTFQVEVPDRFAVPGEVLKHVGRNTILWDDVVPDNAIGNDSIALNLFNAIRFTLETDNTSELGIVSFVERKGRSTEWVYSVSLPEGSLMTVAEMAERQW